MAELVTKAVEDSVPRDGSVAVGEDLEFQRKWWVFERIVWSLFLLILIADLLGALGRGWLAKTERTDQAHGITVDYERVERAGTPSIMTVHVEPSAIENGELHLYVSESVVQKLGAQRISPQPLRSSLAQGGMEYTFPAVGAPATVEFQLQPSFVGVQHFRVAADGAGAAVAMPASGGIEGSVLVLP